VTALVAVLVGESDVVEEYDDDRDEVDIDRGNMATPLCCGCG
jgi:hypothetical protein